MKQDKAIIRYRNSDGPRMMDLILPQPASNKSTLMQAAEDDGCLDMTAFERDLDGFLT